MSPKKKQTGAVKQNDSKGTETELMELKKKLETSKPKKSNEIQKR
jgi:hypothetical protein